MIVVISTLIGIVLGGYQAKNRGGNRKDMGQYAAGYGIAFALVGMVIAVALDRTVL